MTSELVEAILEEYAETQDKAMLLESIQQCQKKANYLDSFELYKAILDRKGMQTTAQKHFVENFLCCRRGEIIRRAGLKLTPKLYNQRADYWFKREYFSEALNMYLKAENKAGVKKSARELEKSNFAQDKKSAIEGYLVVGDKKSAIRMAKDIFIDHIFTNEAIKNMKKMSLPITKKLWEIRAEYQLNEGMCVENAIQAYKRSENKEGEELAKQKLIRFKVKGF